MNSVPDIFRILPEVLLTLTGVVVMLIDASINPASDRKPLGWVAVAGTVAAIWASLWQLTLAPGDAFYHSVETSAFSIFFHVLIGGIVLACLLLSIDALPAGSHHKGEFFALIVFGATGMMLMTCATELLVVFVGLEISSISTYILAGYRKHTGKSPESAIKYFLLGSFATAFFLYGIALLFGATGTTQIAEIARLLPGSVTPRLSVLALAMMIIGLGFKVSAAPFHVWTPDVYEGAPSPVVALMSTAPKAAAIAVLLRILYGALPSLSSHWAPVLWILSVASMTIGNLAALRQQKVKRMLAYSSIAHAGYMLAAFTALGPDGIAAATFYTASYAAMNVGIFAIITQASSYDEHLPLISDYRGLVSRSPMLGGVMAFFLLSLIGIPFTGGFVGKFYVFSSALRSGSVWLGIIGLLNSGIAAYYYLRLLVALFSRQSSSAPVRRVHSSGVAVKLALLLTAAATLILGILPGRVLTSAQIGAAGFAPVDSSSAVNSPLATR